MRAPLVLAVTLGATLGVACDSGVDCENLCRKSLSCEVTFGNSDDPDAEKIESGERTDLEACTLGCEENPAVTADSADCVDDITLGSTDPAECRDPVVACFDAVVAR